MDLSMSMKRPKFTSSITMTENLMLVRLNFKLMMSHFMIFL